MEDSTGVQERRVQDRVACGNKVARKLWIDEALIPVRVTHAHIIYLLSSPSFFLLSRSGFPRTVF
jgi:hypothetical protein